MAPLQSSAFLVNIMGTKPKYTRRISGRNSQEVSKVLILLRTSFKEFGPSVLDPSEIANCLTVRGATIRLGRCPSECPAQRNASEYQLTARARICASGLIALRVRHPWAYWFAS